MTWVIRITRRFTGAEDKLWGFTEVRTEGWSDGEILDLAREDTDSILDGAEWELLNEQDAGTLSTHIEENGKPNKASGESDT